MLEETAEALAHVWRVSTKNLSGIQALLLLSLSVVISLIVLTCVNWSKERERIRQEVRDELMKQVVVPPKDNQDPEGGGDVNNEQPSADPLMSLLTQIDITPPPQPPMPQPIPAIITTDSDTPTEPPVRAFRTTKVIAASSSKQVPADVESTRVKVKRRKKKNGARLGLKNESDTTAMLRGGDENGTFTSDLRTYENEESLYLTSSAQRRRESKTPSIIQQYKQSTKRVRKEETREKGEMEAMEKMSSMDSTGEKRHKDTILKNKHSSSPAAFQISSTTQGSSDSPRQGKPYESPITSSSLDSNKPSLAGGGRRTSDRRGSGGSMNVPPAATAEAANSAAFALVMANIDHHRKSLLGQAIQASKSSNLGVHQQSLTSIAAVSGHAMQSGTNTTFPQSILAGSSNHGGANTKKSVQLMIPASNQPNLMVVAQPRDSQPDALLIIVRNTKVLVELAMDAVKEIEGAADDAIITNLKVVSQLHLRTIAEAWMEMVHAAELSELILHSTAIEESCAIINEINNTFNNYVMNKSLQNQVPSLTDHSARGLVNQALASVDVINETDEAEYYELKNQKKKIKKKK